MVSLIASWWKANTWWQLVLLLVRSSGSCSTLKTWLRLSQGCCFLYKVIGLFVGKEHQVFGDFSHFVTVLHFHNLTLAWYLRADFCREKYDLHFLSHLIRDLVLPWLSTFPSPPTDQTSLIVVPSSSYAHQKHSECASWPISGEEWAGPAIKCHMCLFLWFLWSTRRLCIYKMFL